MDIVAYIKQLEEQNEALKSQLADSEKMCDELRPLLAGRRYEIISKYSTLQQTELTLCNYHSGAFHTVATKLQRIQEAVMLAISENESIDEVQVNCTRYYADKTIYEWSVSIYESVKEKAWFYESIKIRGVEKIIAEHPVVPWLKNFHPYEIEDAKEQA